MLIRKNCIELDSHRTLKGKAVRFYDAGFSSIKTRDVEKFSSKFSKEKRLQAVALPINSAYIVAMTVKINRLSTPRETQYRLSLIISSIHSLQVSENHETVEKLEWWEAIEWRQRMFRSSNRPRRKFISRNSPEVLSE